MLEKVQGKAGGFLCLQRSGQSEVQVAFSVILSGSGAMHSSPVTRYFRKDITNPKLYLGTSQLLLHSYTT